MGKNWLHRLALRVVVNGLCCTWRWGRSGVPHRLSWSESCSIFLLVILRRERKAGTPTLQRIPVWWLEGNAAGRKGLIEAWIWPRPTLGKQSLAGMQAGAGRARTYLWRVALGIGRKRAELGPAMGLDSSDGQQHLRWCKQDMALRFEQGQGLSLLLRTCQTSPGYSFGFGPPLQEKCQ